VFPDSPGPGPDAAQGDLEAEGAELADVVDDLPSEPSVSQAFLRCSLQGLAGYRDGFACGAGRQETKYQGSPADLKRPCDADAQPGTQADAAGVDRYGRQPSAA
jgi:hypothetical protein